MRKHPKSRVFLLCQPGFSISQAAPDQSGEHLRPTEDQVLQRLVLVLSGRPLRLTVQSGGCLHWRSFSELLFPHCLPSRERATTRYGLRQLHNSVPFNSCCYIELTLPSTLEYHHLRAGASQDGHLSLARWKWGYSTSIMRTTLQFYRAQSWVSNSYHKASRYVCPWNAGYLTKASFLTAAQEISSLFFFLLKLRFLSHWVFL